MSSVRHTCPGRLLPAASAPGALVAAEAEREQLVADSVAMLYNIVPRIARMSALVRHRFVQLPEPEQREVIGDAIDRLLVQVDATDRLSTRWLDDETYSDNPAGSIFEWCGFRLIQQALDTVLHARADRRARFVHREDIEATAGAPAAVRDEAAEQLEEIVSEAVLRGEELTAAERELLVQALAPMFEELEAAGAMLDEEARLMASVLAAGPSDPDRAKVLSDLALAKLTGLSRRRVQHVRGELARCEPLREHLLDAAESHAAGSGRTESAGDSDEDGRPLSMLDRVM